MGLFVHSLSEPKAACLAALESTASNDAVLDVLRACAPKFPVDQQRFLALCETQIRVDNRAAAHKLITRVVPDMYPRLWVRVVLFPIVFTVNILRAVVRLGTGR